MSSTPEASRTAPQSRRKAGLSTWCLVSPAARPSCRRKGRPPPTRADDRSVSAAWATAWRRKGSRCGLPVMAARCAICQERRRSRPQGRRHARPHRPQPARAGCGRSSQACRPDGDVRRRPPGWRRRGGALCSVDLAGIHDPQQRARQRRQPAPVPPGRWAGRSPASTGSGSPRCGGCTRSWGLPRWRGSPR